MTLSSFRKLLINIHAIITILILKKNSHANAVDYILMILTLTIQQNRLEDLKNTDDSETTKKKKKEKQML